MLGKKV